MTNRLANSQSLYLRKHAENPIDWWYWCDEAIELARQENKPIFLSVGYSSCHWCTVMEGEAFSDPQIADYLNQQFVPIKVDREERPDIDSLYMQSLQLMSGQGGWPLNVFLLPHSLVPFYGGTYFPAEPRYGRPSFLQVLTQLRDYYDNEKEKLDRISEDMLTALQQAAELPPEFKQIENSSLLNDQLLQRGLEASIRVLEPEGAPCFPMMPYAQTALRGTRFQLDKDFVAQPRCDQRGFDLVLGGIFDQVGGGFHRYTVDATWTVPHFEKMLYDNGQILEYLADLWCSGTQDPAIARAVRLTVSWLKREMMAPEGYFYAAQDADNFTSPQEREPEEGAFYVWSDAELREQLTPEQYQALEAEFYISKAGNFEGKIVLQRRQPGVLSEAAQEALQRLFEGRYGAGVSREQPFPPARDNQEAKSRDWAGRIPPVTDTKGIVAWNSLVISGLARASVAFGEPEYLTMAAKTADFILNHQWIEGRFYRLNYEGTPSVLAQSEDYALFVKALLDLVEAGAPDYLDAAINVQAEFDEHLWSDELGGYYNAAQDTSGGAIVRERAYTDNATPGANGVAAMNLVRLSLYGEELLYLQRAEAVLNAFLAILQKMPQACPSLFAALDWFQNATLVRTTAAEMAQLKERYLPATVLKQVQELPDGAVGLVCQGLSCLEPARDRNSLLAQLEQSQSRIGIG
ncbi:thioredoxin domain-containing protein [Phormidium yuhuli AB48]|uniref:Thioredoxin domain-containing protein n=1 Tax=Phormidium yuhuli AB48 TaxID=2940671 RepID=A0ABY5ATJ4_9CYAN|nr:thioredoxin domain-containing protein [Phormidium yuhuli]USR92539.1 thioredoxin domain-containing protein [Phormidium yuhuli AB48]